MGRRRLFLIAALVMLMVAAAAAAAVKTPRFGIPRFYAYFGGEEDASSELSLRLYGNTKSGTPFALGNAAAIHLGNTKSCIAGYGSGGGGGGDPYRFCIPSRVAFFTHRDPPVDVHGPLVGEAARDRASIPSWTAISGFMRLIHRRHALPDFF
nr:unnamed protein product [Digitaria exilis]